MASGEDRSPRFSAADIAELAAGLTGAVFQPEDAGYEAECATFNLAIKHHPVLVVGAAEPADGRLRRTTAQQEPDLFWALRGSRSNMGVVTALEVELRDVTRLYGGGLFFSGEHAAAVMRAYLRFTADVPEELTSSIALMRLPDVPSAPEVLRGRFMVHLRIAHLGSASEGDRLAEPLRQAAPVVLDTLGEMPFADFASIHQDPNDPLFFREWTEMLTGVTTECVDTLVELAGPQSDGLVQFIELRHLGGALSRQTGAPNAVGNRDAEFAVWIMSMGPPTGGDPQHAYGEHVLAKIQPWSTGRAYLNFSSDTSPEEVKEGYTPQEYARLRKVKSVYDPGNVFRLNHNIPPSSSDT